MVVTVPRALSARGKAGAQRKRAGCAVSCRAKPGRTREVAGRTSGQESCSAREGPATSAVGVEVVEQEAKRKAQSSRQSGPTDSNASTILRPLAKGIALSVVTLAVGSRVARATDGLPRAADAIAEVRLAPETCSTCSTAAERELTLRGGYSDTDFSDLDLSGDEDFEVSDSELRQIGQELESDAAGGGGGDGAGSEAEVEEDEDEILAKLSDMSDPSRRTDPYPWEGTNTKWMNDKDVSVVLPPDERDGRKYLLEVKRDELTGEEISGTLELDLQKGGKIDAKKLQKKYKDKLLVQTAFRPDKLRDMTYSQFWSLVGENQIQKARFAYDKRNVFVTTKPTAPGGQRTEMVGLPPDPNLLDHLVTHGVFIEEPRNLSVVEDLLLGLMRIGIPLSVGAALFYSSSKIGLLAEDKSSSFEIVNPKEIVTTFRDVAGIDIIKNEVQEVVEFLRQPKRFLEMGIRTPAGVLLVGQPGTGKTLLARAVAAEANVPLINCSGAEFVDEYVGMGAAKIRDLFELAREKAPCVIFIDEFDGLGKARTGGAGSEEMHTCNQLLAEMDGFTNNTGVVVLAATNRAFVLDRAVLRPGRFDRVLEMPLPNRDGRQEILEVHGRGKKFEQNVDLGVIAKATPGFTGAELMNLMNQSGLTAIRKGREVISQADVFEALDEIQAERLGESSPFSAKQLSGTPPSLLRKRMSIFATAKALVGCILPEYHELARVSVNPSGLSSTFAHFVPQEESVETNVVDRALLESELVVLMAGYCAEKLAFGDKNVSVLGNADVEHARALARQMVCEYGYGKSVGMLTLPPEEAADQETKVSHDMHALVDADVSALLEQAEVKAYKGLAKNWRLFEALTTKLYDENNIMGTDFASLIADAYRFDSSYLPQEKKEKIVYPDHESEIFTGAA